MKQTKPTVKLNIIDKIINVFSPQKCLQRIKARATLSFLRSSGYITSGSPKRSMRGWNPFAKSADEDTLPNLSNMRADSRDLYMNSPLASGALKRAGTNAIGSGLILQSRIDIDKLGISKEKAFEWERNTEREFDLWAGSKFCDASLTSNFYELQWLVLFNTLLSGDVFALLPYIKHDGFPYDLRVKLIEGDYCCNPQNVMDTASIAGGIEIDENGAPVKYHFKKSRYGELAEEWTSIKTFGERSGRRNVLHLLTKERIGQRRGLPILAPVVESLKQLTRLTEAELMGSILSAFFTVFIKSSTPQGLAGAYEAGDSIIQTDVNDDPVQDTDKNLYEMGSGNIIELATDEEIQTADPNRPNTLFEPFFYTIVKQIGSSIEIPFEQLILHFSSSYSAARGALLEAWKFYRMKRLWEVRNFCEPVYFAWLTEGVLKGRTVAPGFFSDLSIAMAWAGSAWGGPGIGQIDPLKESKGAATRLENYISSYEDEHTNIFGGQFGRWESVMSRRTREKELIADVKGENSVPIKEGETTPKNLEDLEDEK